jgi:hypothetical protein
MSHATLNGDEYRVSSEAAEKESLETHKVFFPALKGETFGEPCTPPRATGAEHTFVSTHCDIGDFFPNLYLFWFLHEFEVLPI